MAEAALPIETNSNTIFESSSYLRVTDALGANIRNETSIIVLTGEPGTGKTLITRQILRNLMTGNFRVFFQDPRISVGEMANLTCGQIGIEPFDLNTMQHSEIRFETFFNYLGEKNREKEPPNEPIRFFIDDAQDINRDTLQSILAFIQSQPVDKKILQLILIGLPKLKTLLANFPLHELGDENLVYLQLDPLDTDEIGSFVAHHLRLTDKHRDGFCSPQVIEKISLYTRNFPGLVSKLVDSVVAVMNIDGHQTLTASIVDDVVHFFSLPWALENKKDSMKQHIDEQENKNSDQSASVPQNNNALPGNTLFSTIRSVFTGLFSHEKNNAATSVAANMSDTGPISITESTTPVPVSESQQSDFTEEQNSEKENQ